MFHTITAMGRLARDPEMKYSGDGKPYTRFAMFCNKYNGESVLLECVAFGRAAELIADSCRKGHRLLVTGELNPAQGQTGPRTYQKKDGTWAASYEIATSSFTFVETKEEAGVGQSASKESDSGGFPF